MHAPVADIEAVRQGTRKVLRAVADLTDEQAAAQSRLPGWTRAEVLTHLARNADGVRGIAEAAARGEVGTQYPGGAEQRGAEIAAGRGARAAALLADLRRSCDALMEAWHHLGDDAWERPGRSLNGERTQRNWIWSRWPRSKSIISISAWVTRRGVAGRVRGPAGSTTRSPTCRSRPEAQPPAHRRRLSHRGDRPRPGMVGARA